MPLRVKKMSSSLSRLRIEIAVTFLLKEGSMYICPECNLPRNDPNQGEGVITDHFRMEPVLDVVEDFLFLTYWYCRICQLTMSLSTDRIHLADTTGTNAVVNHLRENLLAVMTLKAAPRKKVQVYPDCKSKLRAVTFVCAKTHMLRHQEGFHEDDGAVLWSEHALSDATVNPRKDQRKRHT